MDVVTLSIVALQVVVALGLLNVWLVRARSVTPYRGAAAGSLRAEFAAYGLPTWFFYLIGALKVGAAVLLLAGLWRPALVPFAAALVALLMVGAVAMHVRVGDPLLRSVPAFAMLVLSALLIAGTAA